MKGRRLVSAAVLVALGALPGCASWCARNYPCQQPVAYAPAACCCPAPTAPVAPVCAPTSYAPTWSQPAGGTACVPCR
jgi:hypothetical protein